MQVLPFRELLPSHANRCINLIKSVYPNRVGLRPVRRTWVDHAHYAQRGLQLLVIGR